MHVYVCLYMCVLCMYLCVFSIEEAQESLLKVETVAYLQNIVSGHQ